MAFYVALVILGTNCQAAGVSFSIVVYNRVTVTTIWVETAYDFSPYHEILINILTLAARDTQTTQVNNRVIAMSLLLCIMLLFGKNV